MRTDPTDNGGMFVGRRPGTAPVRYRDAPQRGGSARQRADGALALLLLALQVVCNLLFWGPIPAGALWIASQVQYRTDSISLALALGFGALLVVLFGGLALLKRLDEAWVLVRRAAGYDQRNGLLGRIFAICAVIGGTSFFVWLVFIGGLGSSVFSAQG